MTDEGLATIAKCCAGSLRTLRLEAMPSLSDKGLFALAAHCE